MSLHDAHKIYRAAINAVKCEALITRSISVVKDRMSVNKYGRTSTTNNLVSHRDTQNQTSYRFDLGKKQIFVIGGGKCALAMSLALLRKFHSQDMNVERGCISVPTNQKYGFQNDQSRKIFDKYNVDVMFGAKNNMPDADSEAATKKIIDLISSVKTHDPFFIIMISGGGSSCLSLPLNISLEKKLQLLKSLVQRGADIIELNTVRRVFSSVKCGGLARHISSVCPSATVLTLILSDVIGDSVEFIASGPTHLNSNTSDNKNAALAILDKYSLAEQYEKYIIDSKIRSTDKLTSLHVGNFVIGSNELAIESAESEAYKLGYNVIRLSNNLNGRAANVVEKFISNAESLVKCNDSNLFDKFCLLGGGEVTVSCESGQTWGLGGRCQEMALEYLKRAISRESGMTRQFKADLFMAGGTDGQDGPTDFSGCAASGSQWKFEAADTEQLDEALNSHDSTNFWINHKPEWLLKIGPTHTNVMDIYMLLLNR